MSRVTIALLAVCNPRSLSVLLRDPTAFGITTDDAEALKILADRYVDCPECCHWDAYKRTHEQLEACESALRICDQASVSEYWQRYHPQSAPETCPECFGDKTITMSDGSKRACELCSAENRRVG